MVSKLVLCLKHMHLFTDKFACGVFLITSDVYDYNSIIIGVPDTVPRDLLSSNVQFQL